ncbi:UNVERIFIED_CONTAM: LysM peptidoglycan-binding domain-containing protein, partial [Bacillus thuringiensis]
QIIYQVQPGDSLETIAKRYNVTVQSIKQINNTVGNKLYTGQHSYVVKVQLKLLPFIQ